MISRLTGKLISKKNNTVVLEVGGVGYEVELPLTDACELVRVDSIYTLHTHFVVREDAQLLFGFSDLDRRELFRLLIKVNGVGPKVALAILSGLDTNELVYCFKESDVARLTKVPGIGKKTAERLVIEMKDKLSGWIGETGGDGEFSGLLTDHAPVRDLRGEAVQALIALGYKSTEAEKAVKISSAEGGSVEEIIRQALRGMVKA